MNYINGSIEKLKKSHANLTKSYYRKRSKTEIKILRKLIDPNFIKNIFIKIYINIIIT